MDTASHFLQEDQGAEVARRLVAFYKGNYEGGNFGNDVETGERIYESDSNDDPRRYCEILLAYLRNGGLVAEAWGSLGVNTCSSSCLEDLDLEQIQAKNNALLAVLNGPRIWLAGGSNNTSREEVRLFASLEMGFLADTGIRA